MKEKKTSSHNDFHSAKETIQRIIKKNETNNTHPPASFSEVQSPMPMDVALSSRQRVSRKSKPVSTLDRKPAMNNIIKDLVFGTLTQGAALKALRVEVLGLKQEAYANLVSVSRKTLSEIENDKGNYSSDIINKVFKPFGLKVGLVPTSSSLMTSLFKE